jgi:hypothetical protein
MKTRGAFPVVVIYVLAAIGAGLFVLKPKLLDGDSRRAKASVEATAKVETAVNAQGAAAAASIAKIGEANAAAPDSPSKNFIAQEVPAALAKLPAPDPLALLEAEKRRAAVMEGRAEEAARLYGLEAQRSAALQKDLAAALAARHAADSALSEAAAARLEAERQRTLWIIVAGLGVALWLYARAFSITPASLGAIAADVRAGVPAIQAMDTHLAPWLHPSVNRAARLATQPPTQS